LVITTLATLLAACGGGGGGGSGGTNASTPAPAAVSEDKTPPTVTSFLPNASTGVSRTTEISATFDEALLAETVTATNLRLTRGSTAVPGTVTYDATGHKLTFAPERALDLLASYTVTAGTGLKDQAGNSLAAERSWSFKTADGSWQGFQRLDAADATSANPDIAVDAEGNVATVWSNQASSGWYEIQTAMKPAGAGWGSVGTLSTPGNHYAVMPKVRFDGQGNALAVWTEVDGTLGSNGASAWSARYVKGQGWQAATQLDSNLLNVQEVSLAVDAQGNAFAVWARPVGPGRLGNPDVWAARFTPAGGWQAPVRVGSDANIGTYDKAEQPQVALDAAGNAYVLWVQTTSDAPVWFARYQAGSGWQPAVSLGATRLGDPFAPRLAVSPSGQVTALWNSFVYAGGPYRFDLWWSTLASPAGNWSTPALLENDDAGNAMGQVLVADSAGNFHAVWRQYASEFHSNVLHRQYTPGTGWGAVGTVSTAAGDFDNNRALSVVADRNGNLMAAWGVYASGFGGAQEGSFARRYIAGEGWQPTVRLDAAQGGTALATSLAVAPDGAIAATWMEPNPFRSEGPVWVNLLK
jgi:hypothetical protein